MRRFVGAVLALAVAVPVTHAEDCIDADPSQMLAGIRGDFELTVDPQDAGGNIIYISNVADGPSNVVAAKIDGVSGFVVNGSLTKIANNFSGQSGIDGPEFVQKPTGELGVIYAGDGGVHGIFRAAVPAAWNDFRFDVRGAPLHGSPPVLTNTSTGSYPAPPLPLGQYNYGQWLGACQGVCYSALGGSMTTDVVAVLQPRGLTVWTSAQSPRDGYVFISACDATGTCGLYEAYIDPARGFVMRSFQKLASAAGPAAAAGLVAARHPVTGSTVLFSTEDASGSVINVWEQPEAGGPLTPIGRVPVTASRRYRAEASTTQVVLHYLVRAGKNQGSYVLPVGAPETTLVLGAINLISTVSTGAELAWMPAASSWALFYRRSPVTLTRCWVTP